MIEDIKQKMKSYGLTAQDLGLPGSRATPRRKSAGPAVKTVVKYRGPDGEGWSGGRGRKPRWVTEALAKGKKLEDFAV